MIDLIIGSAFCAAFVRSHLPLMPRIGTIHAAKRPLTASLGER
jgi:hypothetical protein